MGWKIWIASALVLAIALVLILARSRDGTPNPPGRHSVAREPGGAAASTDEHGREHASRDLPAEAPPPRSSGLAPDEPIADEPGGASAPSLDDAGWDVIERRITAAVEHARSRKRVHVSEALVEQLRKGGEVAVTVELASGYHSVDATLSGTRHAAPYYLTHVPYTQVRVGPQALENLLLSASTGSVTLGVWSKPTLAQTVSIVGADIAQASGATGEGFTVVVVDTGVETTHPFFEGRIVDGHCYSTGRLCPRGGTIETDSIAAGDACVSDGDDCGHGTGVAGAAVGADGSRVGVAPAASLISIMAASPIDEADIGLGFISTDLVRALEKVYSQRDEYVIASVNLSLGTDPTPFDACQNLEPSFNDVVALLREAEIAVVAASGNDGELSEGKENLAWPACVDGVISVGATTKGDEIAVFSSSSRRLNLLAPGVDVTTAELDGGYASFNGTSIAAPLVAGAFAAIRSVYPDEQTDRILLGLDVGGKPIDDPENGVTTSRINVASAIMLIEDGDLRWDYEKVYDEVFAGPSKCGLIGIELLLPLAVLRALRRRRSPA